MRVIHRQMVSVTLHVAFFLTFLASPGVTAQADDAVAAVVDQIDVNVFRHYMEDLLYTHDGDNRGRNSQQHDLARDNIKATLESFGLDTYLDPFQVGNIYYNVVAVHPGLVTPDQQYIISGHYDSVGNPGADDDASGCAAVMEIARVLSKYNFESTLIFITFDFEEGGPGREGSSSYAQRHQNDDIRGMVAIDMIAHNIDLGLCDIHGRQESNEIKLALTTAVETYGGGISARLNDEFDCCDHMPFADLGFPACVIVEGDGPWGNPCYHQPCDSVDTAGNIDYDYVIQIVRGVAGYLAEQAGLMPIHGDLTDFEIITGSLLAGDLSNLEKSDDIYVHTRSGFGQTLADLHNMEMRIDAITTVDNASTIDLTIESRMDEPAGSANIGLRNFNSGNIDNVGSYSIGNTDQIDAFNNINATNYIDGSGNLELSIKHVVFVPFLAFTFESFIDQVEITVF